MTECEICGSRATRKAEIDGVILSVCNDCAKLGSPVVEAVKIRAKSKREIDSSRYIDPGYPELIKKAREKREMKIEELARQLNEKESVISRLERGHFSPSFDLAKKLEDFLEIKLILEYEGKAYSGVEKGGTDLTIGDVIDLGELDD